MKRNRTFWAVVALLSIHIVCYAVPPRMESRVKDRQKMEQWVDSVYKSLTIAEQIGQLFMPIIELSSNQANLQRINSLLDESKIGGVLFHKGSPLMQAELTNRMQRRSRVPLLVSLDGEWGLSMRLDSTTRFPRNIALGAMATDSLLYEYGAEVGRQCRLLGIHINFAPVLDVNSNPRNPVIGFRSFGEDAAKVEQYGLAYARGLESTGVLSVAKHFPGHGDTSEDSHKTLPSVAHDRERLDRVELAPFRSYINDSLGGVLTAHLFVPSIEPRQIPSSLSPKVVTSLLQKELDFEGLVFTDALAMKGAATGGSIAVDAFLAGNDVLLGTPTVKPEIEAMLRAVNSGKIEAAEIERRCRKILRYKYILGAVRTKQIDKSTLSAQLNSPEADRLNRELTAHTITVVENRNNLLPLQYLDRTKIASLSLGVKTGEINPFQQTLKQYGRVDHYATPVPVGEARVGELLKQLTSYQVVLVGVHSLRNVPWSFISRLSKQSKVVLTLFFAPFNLSSSGLTACTDAEALVMAYDNTLLAQQCAASVIFGGEAASGKLPINLHKWKAGHGVSTVKTRLGYADPLTVGVNPKMLEKIDEIVAEGLKAKAYPGCQVLIAKDGYVFYHKGFGYFDYASTHPVTTDDVYDVASITKAASTVPALMWLYDRKHFTVNDRISSHLPQLKVTGKSAITVRELLFHESGLRFLPSLRKLMLDETSVDGRLYSGVRTLHHRVRAGEKLWANGAVKQNAEWVAPRRSVEFSFQAGDNLFTKATIRDTILQWIAATPLRPSKRYYYNDVNFILLQMMAEKLSGRSLDDIVEKEFFAKLGADNASYNPLRRTPKTRIAPTENDEFIRRQLIIGYVHDETAAFMGGVAGHAGVFSNANDLAKVCQLYLNGGTYGGERLISHETCRLFTQTKSSRSRRGLGFDKPESNPGSGPTSRLAPRSVYGHTGFTGTCFWVDPDNRLIYVFLSNRVYPNSWNRKLSAMDIRTRIQDVIYESLDKQAKVL